MSLLQLPFNTQPAEHLTEKYYTPFAIRTVFISNTVQEMEQIKQTKRIIKLKQKHEQREVTIHKKITHTNCKKNRFNNNNNFSRKMFIGDENYLISILYEYNSLFLFWDFSSFFYFQYIRVVE